MTISLFMTTFHDVIPKVETGWVTRVVKPIWKLEMSLINVKT